MVYTMSLHMFTCLTPLFRNGSHALSTTIAPASQSQSWWLGTSTSSGSSQRTCVASVKLLPKPKKVLSSSKKVKLTVIASEGVRVCVCLWLQGETNYLKMSLFVMMVTVFGCKICCCSLLAKKCVCVCGGVVVV